MKKVLTKIKSIPKNLIATFAVIATVFGIAGYAIVNADPAPEHHKAVTDNGDGTHKISLNVTGKADTTKTDAKANILIVYDVSGSMNNNSSYVYVKNDTGRYGKVGRSYVQLYYYSNNRYYQIDNDTTSYEGQTLYYSDNGRAVRYTGVTRYELTNKKRSQAAEKVMHDFANALYGYNQTDDADNVEMALITFSGPSERYVDGTVNDATIKKYDGKIWTTDKDTFLNNFSGTENASDLKQSYGGGTNWDAAFRRVKEVLQSTETDSDPTYVIFVTDGGPTSRVGGGDGFNITYANYEAATENARFAETYNTDHTTTDKSNTTVYGIYAYGTQGDYLDDLIYFAQNGSDRTGMDLNTAATPQYYDASDTVSLNRAVNDIFEAIVETLGVRNVEITDGTTNKVKATSGNIDYNLLNIDEESYEYWLSMPVNSSNGTYTMQRKNLATGDDYTITIKKKDATCEEELCTYQMTWEGLETPVEVEGSINTNTFKYRWTGPNDFYKFPNGVTEVPKAILNKDTGAVEWDLSSVGTLLDGVTYTVTFDVWPSQFTLDTIADIKNGLTNYSDLPGEIKEYLRCDANKICKLYTNTNARLAYEDTSDNTSGNILYTDPLEPVPTDAASMTIEKLWNNATGDKYGANEYAETGVTFNVIQDNNTTTPYDTKNLKPNTAGEWKNSVYISAGVIQIKGNKAIIRESGHDYTFAEIPSELDYHWDLEVETVRPMIINGHLSTLVKVEENAPTIGDTNMLTDEATGLTYYKIGNSVYYVREQDSAVMRATNVRRSNLNITKEVLGEDSETAEFTFDLNVKDYNGKNLWFSIWSPEEGTITDDKYVIITDEENNLIEKELDEETGEFNGFYSVKSETPLTVTLKNGWNLRFTNLPVGSTYTFEEKTMPENYVYDDSEGTSAVIQVSVLPVGAVSNNDGTYTYTDTAGKKTIYTEVKNSDNKVTGYTYNAEVTRDGKKISGEIYTGNTSYVVKYTNESLLTNVTVNKIWDDNNNNDGVRPNEEGITLKLFADGVEDEDRQVTITSANAVVNEDGTTDDNTWTYTFKDLPKFKNNKEIVYTVTEEDVENYNDMDNYPKYDNSLSVDIISKNASEDETIAVTLLANGEETSKTVTLDKNNNFKATIEDLDYLDDDGNMITYTTKITSETEATVKLYTDNKTIEITNKHEDETFEISGIKTWNDYNDSNKVRPDAIYVTLTGTVPNKEDSTKNDEVYKSTIEVTNDKWSFTGLYKYSDGVEITYTLTEADVIGYTKQVDGYNVTNTLEEVSISVTKTWDDNSDQDGKRPTTITINLLADGEKIDSHQVTGSGDTWTDSFEHLNKYNKDTGKEIDYTITEDKVTNTDGREYTSSDPSCTNNVCTVTNTLAPETTELTITKTWNDNSDQDGIRPTTITVQVMNGNNKVGDPITIDSESDDVTISEDGNSWTYTITGLDKYENGGDLITYTVVESELAPYENTSTEAVKDDNNNVTGYIITNSYETEDTELTITKTWDDNSDQDGIRPDEITIQVMNGNNKVGDPITITTDDVTISEDGNTWTYTITGLDKYENGGDLITYTVVESELAPYENTSTEAVKDSEGNVTGYTITNSYETEDTELTITKTWDDNSDQDGIRPDEIEVTLLDITDASNKKTVKTETFTIAEDNKNVTISEDGNTWTYTFTGLDKYKDGGTLIVYDVEETAIANYNTDNEGKPAIEAVKDNDGNVTGYTITNTHTPELTELPITKNWVDNFDQDGIRPDSITVQVMNGNKEVGDPITIERDDVEVIETQTGEKWSYTITGLDKYENGETITYTIKEVADDSVVTGTDGPGTYEYEVIGNNITNRHTPETKEIEITKIWKDNKDQDGARPDTINVDIIKNGEVVDTITIDPESDDVTVTKTDDGANWTIVVSGLDKYDGGEEIFYTVREQNPAPYSSRPATDANDSDKLLITNVYTPEETSIEVTKVWDDNSNQDGIRPGNITIDLLADGEKVDSKSINTQTGDSWTHIFDNLPKYKEGGTPIVYTVSEPSVPSGYSMTGIETIKDEEGNITGYKVTNYHELDTTKIVTDKVWDDNDNQDGLRKPYTVTLTGTTPTYGEIYSDSQELAADDLHNEWPGLYTHYKGEVITYKVTETRVDGYDTPKVTGNATDGFVITNTHTPETISIAGKKVWRDSNNLEGYRPDEITVKLLADGTAVKDKVAVLSEADANADGDWEYSFTGLPKYRDGGVEIKYTVSEDEVANYTTSYKDIDESNDKDEPYIIINEHVPSQAKITVKKEWIEESVDGIKDTYGHTDQIKVKLEGKVGNRVYYKDTVILKKELDGTEDTSENAPKVGVNWTYTFENLPEYREATGVNYTVTELTEVPEYNTVVETDENDSNTYVITNIYNPGKTTINGTKVWDDSEDNDGIRPESITVNLFADGNKIDSIPVTPDENGDWNYTFDNLPKMHDKNEIEYTVTEEVVPGYETAIDPIKDESEKVTGYTITNSHSPETVSFKITKIWLDNEDNDGYRPESITVTLTGTIKIDDVETIVYEPNTITISPDEFGDWKYEFTDLNKYSNGELITYSITESEVKYYNTEISETTFSEEENSYVSDITNTHEDETIDIDITKTWDDYDDVSKLRPTKIDVDLLANGEKVETYTITFEDGWTITIKDLPKFSNGEAIVYTIYEHEIAEYETTINGDAENGFEIVNHHELGKGNGPEELPPQTGIAGAKTNNNVFLILINLLGLSFIGKRRED